MSTTVLHDAHAVQDSLWEAHSTKTAHGNREAHAGWVFQCQACGKRSRDVFGDKSLDRGWDESCMLNCQLVKEK